MKDVYLAPLLTEASLPPSAAYGGAAVSGRRMEPSQKRLLVATKYN
jgi:hypothetical protein